MLVWASVSSRKRITFWDLWSTAAKAEVIDKLSEGKRSLASRCILKGFSMARASAIKTGDAIPKLDCNP